MRVAHGSPGVEFGEQAPRQSWRQEAFALPRSTPWLLHAARNSHGVDLGAGKQAVAEQALLVELP
ncbi:hypothetical protein, partial [Mycolicibacterium fortuitum]|uniref:hypothetical protein n=1 Tax=Mycolicibacterium fortuitum TaxID=1766 RepID=UPI001A96CB9C